MRSTLFTVSRSVMYTPAFSSAGRPLGNLSSITRYCGPSALTKGAIYVFFEVMTGAISSIPAFSSSLHTESAGRGVILSIIDQGNDTLLSSVIYSTKPSSTKPFLYHSFAIVTMELCSFSPLWEQLSMDTTASGAFTVLYLSYSRAQTTAIAETAFSGPFSISA